MKRSYIHATILLSSLALLLVAACGGESQPEATGGTVLPTSQECSGPGAADTAAFDQYFTKIAFGSGSAPTGDNGQEFVRADSIIVEVDAKTDVVTRFCVQERSRLGTVQSVNSPSLAAGVTRTDLGTVGNTGTYVVRVWAGDKLVKNLPFVLK